MSKDEEEEREEALAEVADPMFLMHRGDADADGDIEVDDGTGGHMADYLSVSWIHKYCLLISKFFYVRDWLCHTNIENMMMERKDRLNLSQFSQTSYSAKSEQISIYVEIQDTSKTLPADCSCSCRWNRPSTTSNCFPARRTMPDSNSSSLDWVLFDWETINIRI